MTAALSSSDGSESRVDGWIDGCPAAIAAPIQPPCSPPERIRTPPGAPRWPLDIGLAVPPQVSELVGNQPDQRGNGPPRIPARNVPLQKAKWLIRRAHRASAASQIPSTASSTNRIWRPPASGHSTAYLADLVAHPLGYAARTSAPVSTNNDRETSTSVPEKVSVTEHDETEQPMHANATQPGTDQPRRRSSQTVYDDLSPSERSLRHATMNAVPASPAMIASCTVRRSAPLPRSLRSPDAQSPSSMSTPAARVTDTVRTDEMLDSFPAPPVHGDTTRADRPAKCPAPSKQPSWSIFLLNIVRARDAISSAAVQPRSENLHRRLSVGQQHSQTLAGGTFSPPVRGESISRYRHSGVPMYDLETITLRNVDRRGERHSGESSSSASPSLGTRALCGPTVARTENQRAIANGAHRYSCGSAVSSHLAASAPSVSAAKPSRPDHIALPPCPTPVIQGPSFCKHKLAKLKTRQQSILPPRVMEFAIFDGSTGPSEVAPAPGVDMPSAIGHGDATAPISARQPNVRVDRAPTSGSAADTFTTAASDPTHVSNTGGNSPRTASAIAGGATTMGSSRAQLVQRRNEQGTWRTRMSKTKCWRCEIAVMQESWWQKIKCALHYTCLCHYRGYYNDEDPQWKHEQKRAIWRSKKSRVDMGPHIGEDPSRSARPGTFTSMHGEQNAVDSRYW